MTSKNKGDKLITPKQHLTRATILLLIVLISLVVAVILDYPFLVPAILIFMGWGLIELLIFGYTEEDD
jgi:hypothetical protein